MIIFTSLAILLLLQDTEELSWNYNTGGSDWPGYCTTGAEQSPIDITNSQQGCDNTIPEGLLHMKSFQLTEKNTYEAEFEGTETTHLYATDIHGDIYGYDGLQFHIHAPSEHLIDGIQYDLEMHMVHKIKSEFINPNRTHAIAALLFTVDDTSNSTFFDSWTPTLNPGEDITLNLTDAFEKASFNSSAEYYAYLGSLTTPDCNEIVNWYVYATPLRITSAQLKLITTHLAGDIYFANGKGNNRNVQPLNSRIIKKGHIQCEDQFINFFSFFAIYTFLNFFVCKML